MNGDLVALTTTEKKGFKIFLEAGCAGCQNGVGAGGGSLQKFGLYTDYRTLTGSRLDDEVRRKVTGKKSDKDVFKVPGLRNVEKTSPYFHDGSNASLDSSVVIMASSQLNKSLSPDEVRSIVAFLATLTGEVRNEAKQIPPELAPVLK
jgi:cytochrome c peroxidase